MAQDLTPETNLGSPVSFLEQTNSRERLRHTNCVLRLSFEHER